jgi:uncharacterized repeat protein (TIGR01451 family)
MNKILRLLLLLPFLTSFYGESVQPPAWQNKVDRWVLENAAEKPAEFLVYLEKQADLSAADLLPTRLEKGRYVYEQLSRTAAQTQAPLLAWLASQAAANPEIQYRSYWIANMVWVRGDLELVEQIARHPSVARLYANPNIQQVIQPSPELYNAQPESIDAIEWNITKVGAPNVWATGYTGQGTVVAGQDTGYSWNHPALINQYRGWNGAQANHNYHWHDAIHENNPNTPAGNPCGFDSQVPCDDHWHGTHTMGTIVGDDGVSNQIGMAPGARWIGCRNMEQGWGTPTTYTECFQWFIAPTDLSGNNPRPDLAPDVINNSWGCPPAEGCNPLSLLTVVQNVRAAGIVVVQSAGNSGPNCSTILDPASIYDEAFTVGNTTSTDAIASSSSRGPVTIDGSGRMKPDISAPGTSIRSSYPGGLYTIASGTSMAAPHVAGLVALLLSGQPMLSGQVEQIEELIRQTAVPLTSATQDCGGIPIGTSPNNIFGHGRIDAWQAFQNLPHIFKLQKQASTLLAAPGETITYTLDLQHFHPLANSNNVVLSDTLPLDTSFVFATPPYSFVGNTVQWSFGSLTPGASASVKLAVQLPNDASGAYVNDQYYVASNEVAQHSGAPVWVLVGQYFYIFPLLFGP